MLLLSLLEVVQGYTIQTFSCLKMLLREFLVLEMGIICQTEASS